MANGIVTSSADRIVEQGTQSLNNQTWAYRKYESGICEAWAQLATSAQTASGNVNFNGFYFPSFFISVTCLNVNASVDGIVDSYAKYCRAGITSHRLDLYVYKGGTANASTRFDVHIMGTWK